MRTVKKSRHTAFADSSQFQSFEVSAKTGDKVQTGFTSVAVSGRIAQKGVISLKPPQIQSLDAFLFENTKRTGKDGTYG